MTDAEREAWALFRYRLISPLLDPALTPADRHAYTAFFRAHPPTSPTGMPFVPSPRSLRRYPAIYRQHGFDALRPQRRADWGTRRSIPDPLWDQAALLKREAPQRSATQVCAAGGVGADGGARPRRRGAHSPRHLVSPVAPGGAHPPPARRRGAQALPPRGGARPRGRCGRPM